MKNRKNLLVLMTTTLGVLTIIFGIVGCQKQKDMLPTQSVSNEHQIEDEQINTLLDAMDKENYKYSEFVTVKDESGTYYRNYKIYSDDKDIFEYQLYSLRNSTLKIEDKEQFNSRVLSENINSIERNSNQIVSPQNFVTNNTIDTNERNGIHIALLDDNIKKGKISYLKQKINNDKKWSSYIKFNYFINLYGSGSDRFIRVYNTPPNILTIYSAYRSISGTTYSNTIRSNDMVTYYNSSYDMCSFWHLKLTRSPLSSALNFFLNERVLVMIN